MSRTGCRGLHAAIVVALVCALAAASATAQTTMGTVSGKVVDDKGVGIANATVTITNIDQGQVYTITTNAKGEYQHTGLPPAHYKIAARKDSLTFEIPNFQIGIGLANVPPIKLAATAGLATGGAAAASAASEARAAALKKLSDDAQVSFDAGNFDDAIEKLSAIVKDAKCATCYHRIGDAYLKKHDTTNAELNYKKALETDPTLVQSYSALSDLYKSEAEQATDPAVQAQHLADAKAMADKATAVASAAGGAAGAAILYNQGIEFWNKSDAASAQPFFERSIKADPANADAYYFLGMTLLNQGKLKEAAAPFEQYLKLAPNGKNAEMAKTLLAQIK
jgi:tetratricopeptide (TPR) repeat protein